MLLKRLFEDGKVSGVRVLHTGTSPEQNFSTRLVTQAAAEGWLSILGDRLTIHAEGEDLTYTILRTPGYYCVHDGLPMLDGRDAREHIAANYAGVPSPDPANPSGYEKLNHYECRLDAGQHAKYKAKPGDAGALFAPQVMHIKPAYTESAPAKVADKQPGPMGWLRNFLKG